MVFKSKNDHDALKLGEKSLQRIKLKSDRVTYSSKNTWEEWTISAVDFQIITECTTIIVHTYCTTAIGLLDITSAKWIASRVTLNFSSALFSAPKIAALLFCTRSISYT